MMGNWKKIRDKDAEYESQISHDFDDEQSNKAFAAQNGHRNRSFASLISALEEQEKDLSEMKALLIEANAALKYANDALPAYASGYFALWGMGDRLPDEARDITLKYYDANNGPNSRGLDYVAKKVAKYLEEKNV